MPSCVTVILFMPNKAETLQALMLQVRVDCYRVSLLPLKASIDDLMKRLREALGASLRRKVRRSWPETAWMLQHAACKPWQLNFVNQETGHSQRAWVLVSNRTPVFPVIQAVYVQYPFFHHYPDACCAQMLTALQAVGEMQQIESFISSGQQLLGLQVKYQNWQHTLRLTTAASSTYVMNWPSGTNAIIARECQAAHEEGKQEMPCCLRQLPCQHYARMDTCPSAWKTHMIDARAGSALTSTAQACQGLWYLSDCLCRPPVWRR